MAAPPVKGSIRFEDLGEPVQRLLKSLKAGITDEDMALLEYVSVKDMAKIYGEMSSDRHAEEIWEELRAALEARKEKAARREAELNERLRKLEQAQNDEQRQREEEESEEAARERAEEERRQRKAERRKRREEEAAAAAEEEAARLREEEEAAAAAEEEAARLEEEERTLKKERRRKRRAARERELKEEQELIAAEHAKQLALKGTSQKKDWADFVAKHPLEYSEHTTQNIEQERLQHTSRAPPRVTEELLNRTYTPKCPNCGTKFSKPPPEWDCPMCLRRHRQKIKVWQPDEATPLCMVCKSSIGRFFRHHCRNCGRLVCSRCCETRAFIPALGYKDAVKVCDTCGTMQGPNSSATATTAAE